ncbi:MAG: hypothetical protein EU541_03760 [Promethearchaeota archaeon]|nr:MAG: hypothetical protein EU541_03760 [Candidatus Lokiarchaeota archaeon]
MKIWILYDTQFGNGKKLAEFLGKELSDVDEIMSGDVKDINPKSVADDKPEVLILGGAIRMFQGAKKSKKWLKKLNKELKNIEYKIKYSTAFLTHGLPTDKIQGFGKRLLKKLKKATMIDNVYSELLTARVEDTEGPIMSEEMKKSKEFIQDFSNWIHN